MIVAAVPTASASVYTWNFNAGQSGGNYAISNAGGAYSKVRSTYDTVTQRLTFSVTFGDRVTKGFALALRGGSSINGTASEVAMLYFDACSMASPKISVYAYNGANSISSWKDGDGNTPGNQTPDRIVSSGTSGFVNSATARDIDGGREMTFDINVATINSHVPMYGSARPWRGLRFGQNASIWMHQLGALTTTYGSAGPVNGYLTDWTMGGAGYFVGNNFYASASGVVPLPRAAWVGLAGLAGAYVIGRRRKM